MEGFDFQTMEERDGIRFTWNNFPSTRVEAARCFVPPGCIYTPQKQIEGMPPPLQYNPIRCKGANCGAVLNPHCGVDHASKMWTCPFCTQRNHFPPHYADNITETNLPAELIPTFTTVEYELVGKVAPPPIFMFVVDTVMDQAELDELKDSLQQALMLLPPNALVGFISFGLMVNVHELGFSECPKSYVFRGVKAYSTEQIHSMLGINPHQQRLGATATSSESPAMGGRFVMPVSDCSFTLESILEELKMDPWPSQAGQRQQRVVGSALSIAVSVLEGIAKGCGGHIMLFTSGPCSAGPGVVVGPKRGDQMRSHTDLAKGNAPFFRPATEFYDELGSRCVRNGHALDCFACSLDQMGLLEMKGAIEKTGGLVVMADSFKQTLFKESVRRVFRTYPDIEAVAEQNRNQLMLGLNATLEVITSREYKVSGAIGPCCSLKKVNSSVGETQIGEGGTYCWAMGGLDPNSSIALYFEVSNTGASPIPVGRQRYLQLMTQYQHPNGTYRLRVTTTSGHWHSDFKQMAAVRDSFDQEAATVIMARLAINRLQEDEPSDIIRWLDRTLIRLCAKFGEYTKEQAPSFRLTPQMSIYPQFMFHLRRSQFVRLTNCSPDESTYYRMVLQRESVTNSLVMIQPALLAYSFEGPPRPVLLDVTSVKPDAILLLDTFFHVVIYHGKTIVAWREAGYAEQQEHINFRKLLEAPREDAQVIMENRFPVPRYVLCDHNKSQSRFLMAKLNPSVTHHSLDASGLPAGGATPVFSEDVSLKVFMEHLVQLAVES